MGNKKIESNERYYNLWVGTNVESGVINIKENFFGEIRNYIFRSRERVIQNELIKLGWTPPTATVCTVCLGEPVSTNQCICGGTGTIHGENAGLRKLLQSEQEVNKK